MTNNRPPLKSGTNWTEQHSNTTAPATSIRYSLSELASEWHFFNHGVLFTYGGLKFPEEDPLADWYALQTKGTIIMREAFKARIFEGLPTFAHNGSTWDHTLCAVRHEDWQSLWTFLCGTAIVDRKQRRYAQLFSGVLKILDPTLIERYEAPHKLIDVTVFCLDGNTARWEVRPAQTLAGLAKFVKIPARKEIIDKAALILDGDVNAIKDNNNQAITTLVQGELDKCK